MLKYAFKCNLQSTKSWNKGISTRTNCKKLQVGCKAVAQRKVDQRALCCPMDPITSSSEVSFRSQHIMTSVKNTNVGFVKRNKLVVHDVLKLPRVGLHFVQPP